MNDSVYPETCVKVSLPIKTIVPSDFDEKEHSQQTLILQNYLKWNNCLYLFIS